MASLFMRRVVINVHRVLNSSPLPPPPNPLLNLRSLFGYSRISPITSSTGNDSQSNSLHIDLSNEENKRHLFNRLLYRSKQRGFLELDLVLGKWVEDNIHSLDENQIRALVHVLDLVKGKEQNLLVGQWFLNPSAYFGMSRERSKSIASLDTS